MLSLLLFSICFAPPTCSGVAHLPGALHRSAAPRARLRAQRQQEVMVTTVLDDERTEKLYAWLLRAFAGEKVYNDLMLAFGSIFVGQDTDPTYAALVNNALAKLPPRDEPTGDPYTLREREQGSLGAMGAGQWTGQFRTRPHALLDVRGLSSVEEWTKGLPRGARRTLAKANANANVKFTVVSRSILGSEPAPHSSLGHFRCVMDHEIRLLADSDSVFFNAIQHALSRYTNCIAQAGEIREYRDTDGRVIAFAQEATKGRVIRGQWYYATDKGAQQYVWFHSVQELVRRAIEDEDVDFADLGPSGTDAFSKLKEKYGFRSVSDWHAVADYRGPFRYPFGSGEPWTQLDPPDWLFEAIGD